MNGFRKYLSTCLLATAALVVGAAPAWAQTAPDLGTASAFSVLGTTVTDTGSTIGSTHITGNVGSAGAVTLTGTVINGNLVYTGALTNTGGTISGTKSQPLNPQVIIDLNSAWTSVQSIACDPTKLLGPTITGPVTLRPGVYCTGTTALTGSGVLTLDARGNRNAVWIFKIGAALTGTGFSVVMANGAQPCNVFWVPGADVTMTTSAFSGNILAGAAGGGSITLNYGTLTGRALANTTVTMTGANIIGCSALPGIPPSSCKDDDRDGHHGDKDHEKCGKHSHDCDHDGHHGDKDHKKCDKDSGKHSDDCDSDGSELQFPLGRNDKGGKK